MYRAGVIFPRPFAGYRYPRKRKRPYIPIEPRLTVYNRTVVDNVTVTQAIAFKRNYFKSVVHSVTASQQLFRLGVVYFVSVSHDVTSSQSIRANKAIHRSLTDSITATQFLQRGQTVTHNVTVSQTIAFTRALSRSVSHNVTVTSSPFINSPRRLTVFDNVTVTDQTFSRLGTFRLSVSDNVTVTDAVQQRLGTFRVSVVDTVTVTQLARVIGAIYFRSVTSSVTVTQRVNLQHFLSVTHDVAAFQTISKQKFANYTITTTPTLTSNFQRDVTFTLVTTMIGLDIFNANLVYNRTLIDSETVNSSINAVLFITAQGPHPVASGVSIVYGYLTLLESIYGSIVLPVPELNDSIKHNDSISVKRSMSGLLSAYVKKGTTHILNYTWLLDYPKALELKQWALANFSENITLTNWKGEIWYGKIISEDVNLKAQSKYQGNPRQKTSVTILFEGIKING